MKKLTADQRKTQTTARQDEVVAWAKSQGIDSSDVTGFGAGVRGPGMGGRGKGWNGMRTVSPTPTQ